ncbi:Man1-Src1p-C-terminal domain-containing protein [Bombardia bombarda]|uniref:Man1-Src1p-C-terminal domain-containing protein n=1 Tax=Bombardia bombarda TaxID=252184 RepID=A0AA40BYF9_9PEZI|nr:Man1-Src1p-C-terminal domain-containing protein [Bombardia bombarda]
MSDSEVDYLQAGFDPYSLTVPRLRSVLVTHNVQYPATAKKSQLVDLFNEHVAPQSKKILAARARARRTSKGITDADSQSTASTDFSMEQELMPPPTTSRARSPRKTTRVKHDSEESDHPRPAPPAPTRESPRKRQSRSVSTQATAVSDTDTGPDVEAPSTIKRNRRVTPATPTVKLEPLEDTTFFKRTPETADVFSSENPFQSGSPPPTTVKTPSNRRKTTGMDSVIKQKATPNTSRRRTDGLPFDTIDEPKRSVSKTFSVPAAKRNGPRTPEPAPVVEAGEEFTPEEQLALNQEEYANPRLAVARRKQPRATRRSNLSTPFFVLVTTLLGAYAAWYRQEKVAIGYCGLGREPNQLIPANIQLPDWAADLASRVGLQDVQVPDVPDWALSFVEPQCEPCPPHAYCYEDFTVRCEPDFLLKPHPLSLGGLVPLPPTCEPDGEKVRRVQAIANKAVEELRDRRAKYECGEPLEAEGEPVASPSIEVQELKETLSAKRSKRMAAEEFDDLWTAALGELKAIDEVEVVVDETPTEENGGSPSFPTTRLSSTSLARLSYTCAIRRQVKLGLARHRLSIAGLIFSLLSALYGRRRYLTNRAVSAQIPALVDEVLERLANQKEVAFEDGGDDAFLFLPNLRDDVLRSIHTLDQRERIWQRVRAVVEQNSNVRTGQRESHNGEVGRAWEWIGPSRAGAIEGGSARRRRSGRVSWGPGVKREIEDGKVGGGGGGEVVETAGTGKANYRKWEEGRPIY